MQKVNEKLPKDNQSLSTLANNRLLVAIILITTALVVTVIVSLSQGAADMSLSETWQAILQKGDRSNQLIIWQIRMPRILTAMLVGSALGVSGGFATRDVTK